MSGANRQNYGILRVVHGTGSVQRSNRPRRHEPPDPWLDREMRAVFAGLYGASGAIPSRGIYEAAEGYQWPWRKIGKRMREAREKQTSKENVKRLIKVLDEYVDRLYDEEQPDKAA